MKKIVTFILFIGVFAGLTWLVWFRPVKAPPEEKRPEAEVPVHVGKISRATLRNYVVAYGTVESQPKAEARVAVSVPGVVASVQCVEGQQIQQGAVLFELDSRAADVAVQFAERTLERQKKLAQVEGTSQKLLQDAEQQLASARTQQALLQIRSPITGTVTKVNVKAGEIADLTTVLGEVVDLDQLVVSINVPIAELGSIKPGQPVEVTSSDSTNVVNASLSFTSAQVDAKTGSGLGRAVLPVNSGLRLGQFVTTRVMVEERKDCVAVPLTSVAKDSTGSSFIALVDGDKAVLKPVKVGLRDGDLVEVEGEGVEADKPVVTDGAYELIVTQQFATKISIVTE